MTDLKEEENGGKILLDSFVVVEFCFPPCNFQ